MISLTSNHSLWGYKLLQEESKITHFVTHRKGGVSSKSGYESFNLSPYSGDEEVSIQKNREILFSSLNKKPKWFLQPYQTHQDKVLNIDTHFLSLTKEEQTEQLNGIDALITQVPNCCITVATADCVPIMIYDTNNQVVAIVHSGWRGTLLRIVEQTIGQMKDLYLSNYQDIKVCLGPSISLESFEVGEEVYEAFLSANFKVDSFSFYNSKTGKHHLDLWKCIKQSIIELGIPKNQIETANICTYKHPEDFFSARRLGVQSGRTISGILLND